MIPASVRRIVATVAALSLGLTGPLPASAMRVVETGEGSGLEELQRTLGGLPATSSPTMAAHPAAGLEATAQGYVAYLQKLSPIELVDEAQRVLSEWDHVAYRAALLKLHGSAWTPARAGKAARHDLEQLRTAMMSVRTHHRAVATQTANMVVHMRTVTLSDRLLHVWCVKKYPEVSEKAWRTAQSTLYQSMTDVMSAMPSPLPGDQSFGQSGLEEEHAQTVRVYPGGRTPEALIRFLNQLGADTLPIKKLFGVDQPSFQEALEQRILTWHDQMEMTPEQIRALLDLSPGQEPTRAQHDLLAEAGVLLNVIEEVVAEQRTVEPVSEDAVIAHLAEMERRPELGPVRLPASQIRGFISRALDLTGLSAAGMEEQDIMKQRAARALERIKLYDRWRAGIQIVAPGANAFPEIDTVRALLEKNPPDVLAAQQALRGMIQTVEALIKPPVPSGQWRRMSIPYQLYLTNVFEHWRNKTALPVLRQALAALDNTSAAGLEEGGRSRQGAGRLVPSEAAPVHLLLITDDEDLKDRVNQGMDVWNEARPRRIDGRANYQSSWATIRGAGLFVHPETGPDIAWVPDVVIVGITPGMDVTALVRQVRGDYPKAQVGLLGFAWPKDQAPLVAQANELAQDGRINRSLIVPPAPGARIHYYRPDGTPDLSSLEGPPHIRISSFVVELADAAAAGMEETIQEYAEQLLRLDFPGLLNEARRALSNWDAASYARAVARLVEGNPEGDPTSTAEGDKLFLDEVVQQDDQAVLKVYRFLHWESVSGEILMIMNILLVVWLAQHPEFPVDKWLEIRVDTLIRQADKFDAQRENLSQSSRPDRRSGMEEGPSAARVEAAELIGRALAEAPVTTRRQVVAISPALLRQAGYADAVTLLQSVPALQGRLVVLPDVTPQDAAGIVREKVDGFFSRLPTDAVVVFYARFNELAAASVQGRFDMQGPFQGLSYRFVDQRILTVGLEEFLGQILRDVGMPAARSAELAPKILGALGLGQAA